MAWLAPENPELVWFAGPDAVGFLNDLISQEVGSMKSGEVRRSFLLHARGKLDHLLWVLRGDDLVGLVTDPGRGDELAATLTRFRIRVKVDIEPEVRPLWLVVGEGGAEGWSGGRSDDLRADVSWRTTPRMLVAGEGPDLPELSAEEYERLRIEAGEPKWGVDVDEGTIPQETGMTPITVDFDKGCYLGQELVSRIHHRGHVNRHLRQLRLTQPVSVGAVITADAKEVGVVTSVAGLLGLGMVRREVAPGDRVRVGGVAAEVVEIT
jgi:tRNA-modifying protein YgfZ